MEGLATNKFIFIQDSERIKEETIAYCGLERRDIRYSINQDTEVSNFVGIVYKGDKVLVSLPKHYSELCKRDTVLTENISFKSLLKWKLLRQSIFLYIVINLLK